MGQGRSQPLRNAGGIDRCRRLAIQPTEQATHPATSVDGVLLFVVEAGVERLKLGFDRLHSIELGLGYFFAEREPASYHVGFG